MKNSVQVHSLTRVQFSTFTIRYTLLATDKEFASKSDHNSSRNLRVGHMMPHLSHDMVVFYYSISV